MDKEILEIDKFNVISDEENYYFFRALNMADNSDIEQEITLSSDGKINRIRTDRERFEGKTKYTEDSSITLEEVYDHIKMHYRKDTNCISLTSNANIAINYGRGAYKDKYVMIKIPKKEFGEQTIEAGQYMLQELYSRIMQSLEELPEDLRNEILDIFSDIDVANETKELQEIISQRYTAKIGEVNSSKAHPKKGITYSSPKARISSYQSLNEEQLLETNKVYAKLAILENEHILEHVIPHSSNSKLRETIGNAFSSMEVIHYGEIKKENIIEIPKEVADIFALIQQIDGLDRSRIEKLKVALINAVQNGEQIPTLEDIGEKVKKNISIEEMYELTGGTVEYGKANSIVTSMFYLSKARKNAIGLVDILSKVLGQDSEFKDIIEYIKENGFRVEPEIISRQSGKGVKLSESVNLKLDKEEQSLIEDIKGLSQEELNEVLQKGGLLNIQDIVSKTYGKESSPIEKSRYYPEAIISQYNWQEIGIEEFKIAERTELISRLQNRNCVEIYNKLKQAGIEEKLIPTYLLNIATRDGFYEQYEEGKLEELLNTRQDILNENINIEIVERFLGYYDIEGTDIKLKDYQQRAFDNVNELFKDHKFAQVILPTGAGKSFVALAQMQQYAKEHPHEEMLYLAPQDEILNQIKSYIVKYIHGKKDTIGKSIDEIIAEVFPNNNITFESYSGLLAKRGQEVTEGQYGMIVLDELHRTGAKEWEGKIDTLFANQDENVKVLGITATPVRDADGRDMAEENARKLGYTDEEIKQRKHLASNMTLENAIRMGYVVNPKLVYCKYDLISSGKMDELRAKIDSIEDETKRAEELQKYNELRARLNTEIDAEIGEEDRKKLEEDARRNLDSGIGKEEILRQHVKKGGKYIVFIPVTDQGEIEDEDGNRLGTKTGEDKIKAYQDYLNKVFEGTDIVPQCHAMSGSWNGKEKNKAGEDKNQQELNAFESDNSDVTKFMVVMNKANEGLHIEGVDGIIWFRSLDENSRILYLQQLGRAIYALDEDNPLPDDKRPIVIDLANNSLTVQIEKDFENAEPIDDLEVLTIVKEWIDNHDGMLPDRNSSNKQEQHYYAVLRRIQSNYAKYLDGFDNFEDLTDEQKDEIQKIIDLANEIDLWNIELPPIPKTRGSKDEMNPFEINGVLRDYVEFENEINGEITSNQSLKNALEIEEWCKENYGDKQKWDRKLPGSRSEDEEEKRLGNALSTLRTKLKKYDGKKIEEIENEEDRRILEIVRKLDEEYAFGHLQSHENLGIVLQIENWCKVNYGDKEIWDRKLPNRKSKDEEEKRLGNALSNLRTKLKQYEGKKIGEIENAEDRKILEILRMLDEEYAFGRMQSHESLGIALQIENWCKINYGDKQKWDRKLPNLEPEDEEEKRLGNALSALRTKLKKYDGKKIEEIENEEDRRILEIVRKLDEEYAFGHFQLHENLGIALQIENWCKENYEDKEIWDRKLPYTTSEDEEEKRLGLALRNLIRKLKKYDGKKIEEIENEEDRRILEIVRKLDEEYAFGHLQSHENLGIVLQIENWCKVNYGDKEIWDRKLPNRRSEDEEEKRLGSALSTLRKKLKKYEEKELEEVEDEEERRILEIVRKLDEKYNSRKVKQKNLQTVKQQRDKAKQKNEQAKEFEEQVSEELKKRGQVHEEQ